MRNIFTMDVKICVIIITTDLQKNSNKIKTKKTAI